MQVRLQRIVLFTLATLLLVQAASAEERLASSRLRSLGVDTSSLQPIAFSHNDRLFAAFDRASFEEKKNGVFFHLWFFEIERDGRFGKVRSVDVPLASFQQGEFTPDDRYFILVGNRGTTFLSVDLRSDTLVTLLEPQKGQSGFRADPSVLWTEGDKLYVTGFPYDEHRFIETRTIATLRPNAQPNERFQRNIDLAKVERNLDRLWFSNYVTDTSAFYGQKFPEATRLSFWDGERIREFDRGWKFVGFWGNAGRLLYAVRRFQGGESELTLYDSKDNTKKVLASAPYDFRYLFLSRDGKTALTSHLHTSEGRLTPWYAKEADGWTLKPLLTDARGEPRTIPTGWMRLASRGDRACHVGPNGIVLYDLK